ncbi:MAG: hypothetical protein A2798_01535 [Candidatus Levybacteria bacterium RIFCSPHIGHO2_01_FULL_37_17]|nr:MAG: hypothetical protein A2798_01535 [Candidatus Levybacteria bacterium RIFCSPHIGHO2_01_FULL_37_17]OGH37131.1 MAG: hypothetical protein A2959_02395 [Candidatus Levybacteria bacterium RIFCSPLOWO2_01_FULL_38_23]
MDENNTSQPTGTIIENKPLIHKFREVGMFTPKIITVLVLVVSLGVLSGYLLSTRNLNFSSNNSASSSSQNVTAKGTVVGSNDTITFKDTAEGVLKEGGIDGEGAFHLERAGGESQNVYLTSSIVDLSKFVDKKIKVWGQTQAAQHAGWLMDVGKVEVL